MKRIPTVNDLMEMFEYHPDDGVLLWKKPCGYVRKPGDTAGCIDAKGYFVVQIWGEKYKAHRIAWAMTHGEWPSLQIDHANLDRSDNRISNLRLATHAQNMQNCRARSEFKGVSRVGNRWKAGIQCNGEFVYLGLYKTPIEAHSAYSAAAIRLHKDFARAA